MTSRIWFASSIVGAALSLQVAIAHGQRDAGADADVPESAGEFTPTRTSAAQTDTQPSQNAQVFRSTKLIGTTITNAEGQAVGKVVDFVTDAQGNVLYPLVSYSGTPGFSGKLFAIPSGSLRFGADANNSSTAQLSFDPGLLQRAPNFPSSQFPNFGDPAIQGKLTSFFGSLVPASNEAAAAPALGSGSGLSAATVNPMLPLTSGTTSSLPGGSVIGPSGSPAGSTSGASVIGPSGSPASSTLPGGSIIGSSGSPGGVPTAGTVHAPPASAVPGGNVIGPTASSSVPATSERSIIGPSGAPGGIPTAGTVNGATASPPALAVPGVNTNDPAPASPSGGSIIGSTGSPASGTPAPPGGTLDAAAASSTAPGVRVRTNSSLFPGRAATATGSAGVRTNTGSNTQTQLFPRSQNQVPATGAQPPGSNPPGARVLGGPIRGTVFGGAPNGAAPSSGAGRGAVGAGPAAGAGSAAGGTGSK